MSYDKLYNTRKTPQNKQIGNTVENSAGGYSFEINKWAKLDRFLILGSDIGTYYIGKQKLTKNQMENVYDCAKEDAERTVLRITEISTTGRAAKNDPALFALAALTGSEDVSTRKLALAALPLVARTGTHVLMFANFVKNFRGWGRGLRRAVAGWFTQMDENKLAYQAMKYKQRDGWSLRDLICLSHPVFNASDVSKRATIAWVLEKDVSELDLHPQLRAHNALHSLNAPTLERVASLVREHRLPREAIPTEFLKSPVVWKAILESIPMGALIRNLGNLGNLGLLNPLSDEANEISKKLQNEKLIKKSRVHPISVFMASKIYTSGFSSRRSSSWPVSSDISDALDTAFHLSFDNVEPSGKRIYIGLDVSGSMGWSFINENKLINCRAAAAAMCMVTVRSEPRTHVMAFTNKMSKINLTKKDTLYTAVSKMRDLNFGITDCAQPMLDAIENHLKVDAFIIYTDNDTWCGGIHPFQALKKYREVSDINAKLVVVSMQGNDFSIADPSDAGMLDVVGFDASTPAVISNFLRD